MKGKKFIEVVLFVAHSFELVYHDTIVVQVLVGSEKDLLLVAAEVVLAGAALDLA